MPNTPVPTKEGRPKRRAAKEAAKKIKKIANDDNHDDYIDIEDDFAPPKSPFFVDNCLDSFDSPSSLSIDLPSFPLSLSTNHELSLASIQEESCYSEPDSKLMSDGEIERANQEIECEIRRRRRRQNYNRLDLSESTYLHIDLFSPSTKSPRTAVAAALQLTPFCGIETTPSHVYRYYEGGVGGGTTSRRKSKRFARRQTASCSFTRRVRSRRGKKGGHNRMNPRKLYN